MKRTHRIGLAIVIVGLIGALGFVIFYDSNKNDVHPQSHDSYSLDLMSGASYPVATPTTLSFDIKNQTGATLKDFDVVHEKIMHTIVVRKDLAEFQHVHPAFDKATGKYTLSSFQFPSDGSYRIFADFTPSSSQMGPDGMKLTATPFKDVAAGDLGKYQPQPLTQPSGITSVNGIDFYFSAGDFSGDYGKKITLMLMDRQGEMVTDLQPYLGALGHSVVLKDGRLDFIHAHAVEDKNVKQTGEVHFNAGFTEAGTYKAFTQFQRGGQVITVPFVFNVAKNAQPDSSDSMEHMNH